MRSEYDVADIGTAAPEIFERAELNHLRASVSGRLEPACFTLSPEALATVRAVAQVAGVTQGAAVSIGVALAAELFARREVSGFRAVVEQRAAEFLKLLGGPSCPAKEHDHCQRGRPETATASTPGNK